MNTYPDEYLNHYADRYVALRLRESGISLLQYLDRPAACERVAERARAAGRRPEPMILPQEISQAQRDLERGLETCRCSNGLFIEPLHHTRHARHGQSDFTRRVRHEP